MLTLELSTPADDARPVFVAGNFNQWKTRDERFRMKRVEEGKYVLAFAPALSAGEMLEYKYIKGGWESEELDDDGFPPTNRKVAPAGQFHDRVPRWKKHDNWYDPKFYPDIRIVAKQFNIPQLKRKRRISVLLPWDYEQSGDKRYPVLYLQDGQNLFEDGAPYGSWGVDKQLAHLAQNGHPPFIVVAIDHGGRNRINEFSPYDLPKWGEGLGRDYARFMVETLKPYIDKNFRTLPDRAHTGVGGSSMGGLISIYAGVLYPETYSKFMIFSPSLWVSASIYREPLKFHHLPSTRIYLYAGAQEGSNMAQAAQRFMQSITQRGLPPEKVKFKLEIDPNGHHNEARWGKEFPKAAQWLFEA